MTISKDPTYPLFPVLSFLGFVLALVPLPWHLQAWNTGTCAFMLWTSLACLVEFINSLIWAGNVENNIPVWCDISSKYLLGAGVGITASTLCISRRLHAIATIRNVSTTVSDKRRNVIIDICIAVGIPVLVMALHYIVQPHRFDILEDVGCFAAVYNTLPAYFLVFMWPVLLGSISFVYSALTFRAFWKRRLQFSQLMTPNSNLNMSRYIRLMLLAAIDMMFTVPLGVFSIYIGTHGVVLPAWVSWEDTHFNFSRVQLVPALFWRSDPSFRTSVELTRWLYPASAFAFFALFGFASEAQRHYKLIFSVVVKPFVPKPASLEEKKPSPPPSLPSYVWTKPIDTKSRTTTEAPPLYTTSMPSGKSSRFSLSSSNDVTLHLNFDLEKSIENDPESPMSTTYGSYAYPPSTTVTSFSITDSSPNPSVSRTDPKWPLHAQ